MLNFSKRKKFIYPFKCEFFSFIFSHMRVSIKFKTIMFFLITSLYINISIPGHINAESVNKAQVVMENNPCPRKSGVIVLSQNLTDKFDIIVGNILNGRIVLKIKQYISEGFSEISSSLFEIVSFINKQLVPPVDNLADENEGQSTGDTKQYLIKIVDFHDLVSIVIGVAIGYFIANILILIYYELRIICMKII